jgi:hypothetical protein
MWRAGNVASSRKIVIFSRSGLNELGKFFNSLPWGGVRLVCGGREEFVRHATDISGYETPPYTFPGEGIAPSLPTFYLFSSTHLLPFTLPPAALSHF